MKETCRVGSPFPCTQILHNYWADDGPGLGIRASSQGDFRAPGRNFALATIETIREANWKLYL
jgi:hypothetical protein